MQPEIIKVADIHGLSGEDQIYAAVGPDGLSAYRDRLIQDANGDYYYLDIHEIGSVDYEDMDAECQETEMCWLGSIAHAEGLAVACEEFLDDVYENIETKIFYKYKAVKIPLRLAWYIIDTLRVKSKIMNMGSGDYGGPHGGEVEIYLPPGTNFTCSENEHPVPIPAKLRPVIVEKL